MRLNDRQDISKDQVVFERRCLENPPLPGGGSALACALKSRGCHGPVTVLSNEAVGAWQPQPPFSRVES